MRPETEARSHTRVLRSSLVLGLEGSDDTLTASAADEELTFVLAVEVDEDLTGEEARLEGEGTGHTGLFVDGEEASIGPCSMSSEARTAELCSTADAVVSTRVVPSAWSIRHR